MMDFAWAWCFLALPLPWLVRRWLPPAQGGAALRVPSLPVGAATEQLHRGTAASLIALLAWLLLVLAAARPQMPGAPLPQPASGRELMLAFDVSASMASADMGWQGRRLERLDAARLLAGEFLARRAGDRIGLIVFGAQAYLHTPPSFDLDAVRAALDAMEPGFAGRETALGDAIGLAVKHLRELPGDHRVLILLTDGVNTAGTLTPTRAAWLAAREGVRIHAVAIGGSEERGGGASLDENTLQDIAQQTGGSYQRAADAAALDEFFRRIGAIEAVRHDAETLRPVRELYFWPLGSALLLLFGMIWRHTREEPA